ncbi:alpha-1-inhibitor 3-like [Panulirus ornatus]|uniref:alpha-1-inhibitor 3-like n=1 Tax=Panulirus ornatus TaxID=150431 RepID=UPI003A87BD72
MASRAVCLLLVIVAVGLVCCSGDYVITLPREWTAGGVTQMCIHVVDPAAPPGSLTLSAKNSRTGFSDIVLPPVTIPVPAGKSEFCKDVMVPSTTVYSGRLSITGSLSGIRVNHTAKVWFQSDQIKTFIQTDKYLYQPSQKVQIRLLSLVPGHSINVSTEEYPEVWVTTPSNTRVAQWKNVDNSAGLVHLDMTLADEPEQGAYSVFVKTTDKTTRAEFKVEEYVLPRFEVTVAPPKYLLSTDTKFSFTVCAKYTFGQPVQGNLTLEVKNRRSSGCRVNRNITDTISGCKEVEVNSADVRMIDCNVGSLYAKAIVTEEDTGVSLTGSGRVYVTRTPVTFTPIYKDNYMKPNLPYTLKVKAELPDKTPAVGTPVEVCAADLCYNLTTPEDGVITTILSPSNINKVLMKALISRAALRESSYSVSIKHYFSPSNSSLLIHAPEGRLNCVPGLEKDYLLPVLFSTTKQNQAAITVQVVSRRQIQYWSTDEYQLISSELPVSVEHLLKPLPAHQQHIVTGVINIPITLPPTASPVARVIVWYVREDGEVVSDIRELKVDKCLPNTVDLSWSVQQTQPKEQATLTLASGPNSICSLGVVDKSVELLNPKGDTFSLTSLFSSVEYFRIAVWRGAQVNDREYCQNKLGKAKESRNYNYFSKYVDALKMFDDSGLFIFSNLRVETRPCEKEEYEPFDYYDDISLRGGDLGVGLIDVRTSGKRPELQSVSHADRIPISTSVESPRTYFPETWLWDLTVLPSSGVSNQKLTLPDTITQWVGKAVCVNPEMGVGVSQRANITTFTSFFIELTLPPSVKRGEILPVKISVFNYLRQALPVSVTLRESPEYEILQESSKTGIPGQHISCVAAQSKVVHTVKISPSVIGQVNITVAAFVDHQSSDACGPTDTTVQKSDILIKPITVEAEGFLREKTWTRYVCSQDLQDGNDSLQSWEVAAPQTIVEGSDRGWVTVVGDLLALSLENLGYLIRMPYGCGEQNMLNFAPNIFILQYLKATRQDTPEATKKLVDYMKTGYQRELLYLRDDGSFSAFGKADDSGSTWLTAFVLKSFAQAQPFITIDEKTLEASRSWLQENQTVSGCFRSIGKVFHKGMKGGIADTDSLVPLTAYVMIALLEAGEEASSPSVVEGSRCLAGDFSQDPYTQALKAYALALAKLPEAQEILDQLLEQAIVAKNSTYWEVSKGQGRSNSLAVETAGYAILAMMARDAKKYEQQARKVVKWITAQRNGQGGFFSTQDTVVALQAMASFESHLYQGDLDMAFQVKASGLDHTFSVDESNKLLTQLIPLPTLPTTLNLDITGQGCAVFQSVLRYNIPEPEPSDAFTLTVNTKTEQDKACVTKRISACVSYLLPDGKSNMAVIEVNLVSGYIPEKVDLKQIVENNIKVIKKYEVDGSKVSFYIEEFTAEEVCVSFRVIREVDIENAKPGTVVVYDYYQPEFSINENYKLPSPNDCIYAH